MVVRGVRTLVDNFDRALTLTTTPEGGTGWTVKDTSAAGAPTFATINNEDGGGLKLTLEATDEVQVVTVYQNDILMLDSGALQALWWVLKVAAIDALTVLTAGLASAQADDEDAIPENAWVKMEGATSTTALVVETDDGTNDNNDVATGITLAATYLKCKIDFTQGLKNVRFIIDGDRVAQSTTFDMSDITSGQNVQPFVQLSKPSGTGVPSVTLAQFGVQYRLAYGA